jgi:hypothetical protein
MTSNDKSLQEAKKLNEQSRQGTMTSSISTTDYNSQGAQEARELNSQASSGAMTSSSNSASFSNSSANDLEEAKKANQKSRQSKGI